MEKKLNFEYPKYAARRYAIVVKNNPHNLPVIDPTAFVLARAYLMHRSAIASVAERFFDDAKKDKSHPYHFIAKDYRKGDFADEITKGVKRKHGSKKLIMLSGVEAVCSAAGTRHVLSGEVMPYDRKKDPKHVQIDEYLATAREEPGLPPGRLYTAVSSDSADANFTHGKPSFDGFGRSAERRYNLVDISAAALLIFASERQGDVRGLDDVIASEDGLKVWLPFSVSGTGPSRFMPGQDADHILAETLFDYYMRGRTKKEKAAGRTPMNQVDIAKRLLGVDFIYDGRTIKLITSGNASFQVIEEEMILERNSDVPDAIKSWYWGANGGGMRAFLKQFYEPDGLVYVKKGCQHETVAESYKSRRGDDIFRIVFGDFPPLVMRLWPVEGREHDVKILYEEANPKRSPASKTSHPYAELYQPKMVYDDATRKFMWAAFQLPQQAEIPQQMLDDMLSVAEQNGVSRKEMVKRMIVHDARLRESHREYMCTNSEITRKVHGVF